MSLPTDGDPGTAARQVVAGRYRLGECLGGGGGGRVFRAVDLDTGTAVALKIMTSGDRVARARFANEARVGASLRHPNITRVLDTGTLGGVGAYMAMEYVDGRTWRQLIGQDAPILAPSRVGRWFDQLLDALHQSHLAGFVHRDLKPDNIMLVTSPNGDDTVKILDFGLAKVSDATGSSANLTAAGMVLGTLAYISPEQLNGEVADHRSDIFTAGIIAYEALTGRTPFFSPKLGEMLQAVAKRPFSMACAVDDQQPVAASLGRALEKVPADRYDDAEAFRRELIPALANCSPFPR